MARCRFVKSDGTPCRANARRGSRRCFFHSTDAAAARARQKARKAGGRARSRKAVVLPRGTSDVPLESVADVVRLLATTINRTQRGAIDVKVANATGYLASVLLRTLQESDIETRLRALEEALNPPLRVA